MHLLVYTITVRFLYGSLVKRLRRGPFTAKKQGFYSHTSCYY